MLCTVQGLFIAHWLRADVMVYFIPVKMNSSPGYIAVKPSIVAFTFTGLDDAIITFFMGYLFLKVSFWR